MLAACADAVSGIDDAVEVRLDRGGVERFAVVEGHVVAQGEHVLGAVVLDLPLRRQPRREGAVGLLEHQRVEHGALHHRRHVELARLRVHVPGRQVRALDRPHDLAVATRAPAPAHELSDEGGDDGERGDGKDATQGCDGHAEPRR